MEKHPEPERVTPPYTSYSSLKTLLKNLKEHGVPSRIDRSVLGNSFSNAVGSQILTALKFLTLVDASSHPLPKMTDLVSAYGTEAWATKLRGVLSSAYDVLFRINLETASPSQFNERFRAVYPGTDDVQRKSMTFFLNAAQDAGVKISPYILKNKKPRAASGRKRTTKTVTDVKTEQPIYASAAGFAGASNKSPSETLLGFFNPIDMDEQVQGAVWTLIKYFKQKGQ